MKRNEPEIKTQNELQIFIAGEFSKIHQDWEKTNQILLSNGKASMEVRMDPGEKAEKWAIGIMALLATAFRSGWFAHYFSWIEKRIKAFG